MMRSWNWLCKLRWLRVIMTLHKLRRKNLNVNLVLIVEILLVQVEEVLLGKIRVLCTEVEAGVEVLEVVAVKFQFLRMFL